MYSAYLVSTVYPEHVLLEITTHCCTVATPRDHTGVRTLPRVGTHMRLEFATHCCTVATARDLTRVGSLPSVGVHVHSEFAT